MIKCRYCKWYGEPVTVKTLDKWEKKQRVTLYCCRCGNELFTRVAKKPKLIPDKMVSA